MNHRPPPLEVLTCLLTLARFLKSFLGEDERLHTFFYGMVGIDLRIRDNFLIDLSALSNPLLGLKRLQLSNVSLVQP